MIDKGYDAYEDLDGSSGSPLDKGQVIVLNQRALVVRKSMLDVKGKTDTDRINKQYEIIKNELKVPDKSLASQRDWFNKNRWKPDEEKIDFEDLSEEAKIGIAHRIVDDYAERVRIYNYIVSVDKRVINSIQEEIRQYQQQGRNTDSLLDELKSRKISLQKNEEKIAKIKSLQSGQLVYDDLIRRGVDINEAARLSKRVDISFKDPVAVKKVPASPAVKSVDEVPAKPVAKAVDEAPAKPTDPETQKMVEHIDSLDLKKYANSRTWDEEIKYYQSILKEIEESTWETGYSAFRMPDWAEEETLGKKIFWTIRHGKRNTEGGREIDFLAGIDQMKRMANRMLDQSKRFRDDLEGEIKRLTGVDNILELLRETFATENVAQYMGIKPAKMRKVIKDNKFKNSAESGKGTFSTTGQDRFDLYEQRIFNLPDMDVHEGTNYNLVPKYGFIESAAGITEEQYEVISVSYGSVIVKFKNEFRQRSTVTLGDSMNMNPYGLSGNIAPAVKIDDMATEFLVNFARTYIRTMHETAETKKIVMKKIFTSLRKWAKTKDINDLRDAVYAPSYVEWQVFGNLTLDHVDEIIIGNSLKEYNRMKTALKKAGYGHIKITSTKHRVEVNKILLGSNDAFDSLSPADIDNLPLPLIKQGVSRKTRLIFTAFDECPDELKPMAKRLRQIVGIKDGMSSSEIVRLKDNALQSNKIPEQLMRDYLKEYYRLVALKKNGPMPRWAWVNFKSTVAGWTEDLVDKSVLNN